MPDEDDLAGLLISGLDLDAEVRNGDLASIIGQSSEVEPSGRAKVQSGEDISLLEDKREEREDEKLEEGSQVKIMKGRN